MALVHATCVAVDGVGLLLRGPSGAGKSDLALRLMDGGAALVADDYCEITRHGDTLKAAAPANIRGKMEVRGYGIVELPCATGAALALVVDLMPAHDIPRLPETLTCDIEGVTLPRVLIDPAAPSADARIRLILRVMGNT